MARSFPSTIAEPVEHEIVITKSRFVTTVAPVSDVADAERVIAEVKRRYWDARHNCTAMVTGTLGDQARSSDDGEPSGTAGVPMLEVLRRRDLTDVVAVVTRYFGGVKLGAGGLVRAYSSSVSEALDTAALVHAGAHAGDFDVPHAEAGRLDNVLRDWVRHHHASLGANGVRTCGDVRGLGARRRAADPDRGPRSSLGRCGRPRRGRGTDRRRGRRLNPTAGCASGVSRSEPVHTPGTHEGPDSMSRGLRDCGAPPRT